MAFVYPVVLGPLAHEAGAPPRAPPVSSSTSERFFRFSKVELNSVAQPGLELVILLPQLH